MLGKKLGKHFDRFGYKLGTVPMPMGGKLNHKSQQAHQPEPDKPIHSDLERNHPGHNNSNHEERPRHHH